MSLSDFYFKKIYKSLLFQNFKKIKSKPNIYNTHLPKLQHKETFYPDFFDAAKKIIRMPI